MTPQQCKAARALLGWTQMDLGERAGYIKSVISAVENKDKRHYGMHSFRNVKQTLEGAGIVFLGTNGVVLTPTGAEYLAKEARRQG